MQHYSENTIFEACGARTHHKILLLRDCYGGEGYWLYLRLIDLISRSPVLCLSLELIPDIPLLLSPDSVEIEFVREILRFLCLIDLFWLTPDGYKIAGSVPYHIGAVCPGLLPADKIAPDLPDALCYLSEEPSATVSKKFIRLSDRVEGPFWPSTDEPTYTYWMWKMLRALKRADVKSLLSHFGWEGYGILAYLSTRILGSPGKCFSPALVCTIPAFINQGTSQISLQRVCAVIEVCVDLGLLELTAEGYKLPQGSPFEITVTRK